MTIWEILEGRKLDVERLSAKGWDVLRGRDGGEELLIPFLEDGRKVGHKVRRFYDTEYRWVAKWDDGPVAYNADCLRDDSLIGQPLIITEGEMDCEAFLEAGYQRVISVPNGGGSVSKNRTDAELVEAKGYDWLRKLEPYLTEARVTEVILATDGDEVGAALQHDLSVQLGRYRCKFLTYPKTRNPDLGRERLKDANEVLVEYGQAGVVAIVQRAGWVAVAGVYKMSELPPLPPETVYEVGFDGYGENCKLRLGDLSVVTGVPGFGKSTFINDLCCRVIERYKVTVSWGSFEQAPQRDHKRNLRRWIMERPNYRLDDAERRAADGWIDKHHVFMVPDENIDATLEWALDCMEACVRRHDAKIIVLDPWNELEHVREGRETETEYIGRALRTLKRFAKKFQVHIILVAHPSKLQKVNGKYEMPSLYDINGSANYYNKCDLGIIVHRPDADSTVVKTQKSRYHDTIGKPGEMKMEFCKDDGRFKEIERLA